MASYTELLGPRGRLAVRCALLSCALLVLPACGTGDIEFKGKIFDVMGVNGDANKGTPNMKQRTGLVTPPSLDRLPEPGKAPEQPQDALASINDPDRVATISNEELARKQEAYCKKHYDPAVFRGDASADSIEGPAGPCRRSVVTAIQKWSKGDEGDQ